MWLGGVDEMLAMSRDGGRTWQVKHQKVDGEVLLTVDVREKMIYASGTNGITLRSDDGGETWTQWKAGSERVIDTVFADASHGLRHTLSSVEITEDGGTHWSDVSVAKTDEAVHPYSNVLGIAAVDAAHFTLLLNMTQGENIFLSTQDGGATWKPLHIDNAYAKELFVHDGEFWAFGMEIVDRQNHGGYGVPLVLHSSDGRQWVRGTKAPTEFTQCTSQGCVLYDGAIADLYNEKPSYTIFPAGGFLTPKWAISKGNICTVGSTFRCAAVRTSEDLPPRPKSNRPISIDPGHNLSESLPECLTCPLNPFPLKKQFLEQVPVSVNMPGQQTRQMLAPGLRVTVGLRYRVRRDGTVDQVQVRGAPRKEIEAPLLEDIVGWVFDPPRATASPEGGNHEIKVLVSCMAFPSDVEATCTPLIPPQTTKGSSR
jgi:hypothetical protein